MKKLIPRGIKRIWWKVRLAWARARFGNCSRKMKVVGVTGTNGKTTTVALLHQVANGLGYKAGRIGTGTTLVSKEELKLDRKIPTTPDSVMLAKILHTMHKAGCQYVFMEVSSHAMVQHRLDGIRFTGGIFTNLTQDHLDYHKNFTNYFLAKRKFFQMLPRDAWTLSNDDDERGEAMIAGVKAQPYFYGFSETAKYKAEVVKLDFNGIELKIGKDVVKSKLLGRFNAYNVLTVWATCDLLGFEKTKVKKLLAKADAPTGRFEYFISDSGVMVVVDFAHTPDALEKSLMAAGDIKGSGRLISVFGCGGDRDKGKRPQMAKIGANLSDLAIFTSDNPRSEEPGEIIRDMMKGLNKDELIKVRIVENRLEAIKESVKVAKKGDVILCAGKGYETYQEVKGEKHHFNDMEEYRKLLPSQK